MFTFEELDEITRGFMLREFEDEEGTTPYRSRRLSALGLGAFPDEVRRALRGGDEETLADALSAPSNWVPKETYMRNGVPHQRTVNPRKAAEFLAYTEFNTWYVRGFAKRLLSEGVTGCEVYRAAPAWEPRAECVEHEGILVPVDQVYARHRVRYWPAPGNAAALSIPAGTNCHHSIRRTAAQVQVQTG